MKSKKSKNLFLIQADTFRSLSRALLSQFAAAFAVESAKCSKDLGNASQDQQSVPLKSNHSFPLNADKSLKSNETVPNDVVSKLKMNDAQRNTSFDKENNHSLDRISGISSIAKLSSGSSLKEIDLSIDSQSIAPSSTVFNNKSYNTNSDRLKSSLGTISNSNRSSKETNIDIGIVPRTTNSANVNSDSVQLPRITNSTNSNIDISQFPRLSRMDKTSGPTISFKQKLLELKSNGKKRKAAESEDNAKAFKAINEGDEKSGTKSSNAALGVDDYVDHKKNSILNPIAEYVINDTCSPSTQISVKTDDLTKTSTQNLAKTGDHVSTEIIFLVNNINKIHSEASETHPKEINRFPSSAHAIGTSSDLPIDIAPTYLSSYMASSIEFLRKGLAERTKKVSALVSSIPVKTLTLKFEQSAEENIHIIETTIDAPLEKSQAKETSLIIPSKNPTPALALATNDDLFGSKVRRDKIMINSPDELTGKPKYIADISAESGFNNAISSNPFVEVLETPLVPERKEITIQYKTAAPKIAPTLTEKIVISEHILSVPKPKTAIKSLQLAAKIAQKAILNLNLGAKRKRKETAIASSQ